MLCSCQPCDISCSACTGPSVGDCIECAVSWWWEIGACVQNCSEGYYGLVLDGQRLCQMYETLLFGNLCWRTFPLLPTFTWYSQNVLLEFCQLGSAFETLNFFTEVKVIFAVPVYLLHADFNYTVKSLTVVLNTSSVSNTLAVTVSTLWVISKNCSSWSVRMWMLDVS